MEWPQIVTTITEGNAISTVVDAPWVSVTSVNGMTGDVTVESTISPFQPNHYYPKNTVIIQDGLLYAAKNNFTSGSTFNASDWTSVELSQVQADWSVSDSTSKAFIKNKPTIGNATLTIQKNGSNVQTFTANATSNKTANITVPTKTSDITNDSNFAVDANYVHTDNNFTTTLKNKLDGIAEGAEVNVQSDWNQSTTTADDYIKNKPTIGNATLTIQKNGSTVKTFTANATSNVTANITVPTKTSDLTNDSNFPVDASYVHTDNNYTTTEKNKLAGIASGAEVNQNAFSNVKVGSTTVAADAKTDTLELVAGTNVTLTPDATNDKVTIAATNTTYSAGTNIDITSNTIKTKTLGVEYIMGTQSASTNAWTGVSTDTDCSSSTIYTGKVIIYHLPYAGTSTAATLNLTLPDGTTTGAKNVNRLTGNTITTNFGAGCDIFMVFDGTRWKVSAYQDSDSYYLIRHQNIVLAADAITSGRICIGNSSGYKMAADTITSDITYPILYAGSNVNSGATSDNFYDAIRSINLQNTKSGWTGTANKMVFLVGTLSGTTFTVDSSVFTQTIPSSADGKVYAPIGLAYSTTQIYFFPTNTYWEYRNGAFRPISSCPTLATVATSGSYNDLSNKPTIPTVNNATLTITQNGTSAGTFTANASSNKTIALTDTTYSDATTSASGLMSASDKTKLNGIATGAEVNVQSDWNQATTTADDYIKNKPTLATVATSGSYNDLSNKPTIPTVNNATLTIQKNGSTVKTFTANASSNVTANITVPTKTSDITNDSDFATNADTQKWVSNNSTVAPNFEGMTPVKTFTWSGVADTNYRAIYQFDNTGWTYDNMDVEVAYRITVTGTNIKQVTDVVDRWIYPLQWPITSVMCRTLSSSGATTGYRYLRATYPLSAGLNNNTYKFGQEIANYNTTSRNITIEVFKTQSEITWNETRPSASIYTNSTYQTTNSIQPYATRGWIFRAPSSFNANSADAATRVSSYESVTINSSAVKSGEALTAGYLGYQADDGLIYMFSNTTQNMVADENARIGLITTGYNANTAIDTRYFRSVTNLSSTQVGYISHATLALGDRVYLRCTMDSNGNVHSDNYLATSMASGYTWLPIGVATATNTIYLDTRKPTFYTLNAEGKVTHINGKVLAGSGGGGGGSYTAGNHISIVNDVISAVDYVHSDTLTAATTPSGTVTTAMIADGAITADKLASGVKFTLQMSTTDISEGSPLATNTLYGVYSA